jgi:hypothetical protein
MASCFRRSSPDPWFGPVIELNGGHLHRTFNLISIGETLPRQRITAEEAPPALLQIEPTRPFGNEHMMQAWMVLEPGARLETVMTAEIVCDDENVARWIVRFDVFEQFNVVLGIARSGTFGDLLAIADSQRPIDPQFVIASTVLQWGLDAMAIG